MSCQAGWGHFFLFVPGEQIHDAMCIYLLIHAYLSERHSRQDCESGGIFPLTTSKHSKHWGREKKKTIISFLHSGLRKLSNCPVSLLLVEYLDLSGGKSGRP